MVRQAQACAESLSPGEPFDLGRTMMQLTLGIVSEALFGADLTADASRIGDALVPSVGCVVTLTVTSFPVVHRKRCRAAQPQLSKTAVPVGQTPLAGAVRGCLTILFTGTSRSKH